MDKLTMIKGAWAAANLAAQRGDRTRACEHISRAMDLELAPQFDQGDFV